MPLKESELSKMPVISAEHVLRFLIIINFTVTKNMTTNVFIKNGITNMILAISSSSSHLN